MVLEQDQHLEVEQALDLELDKKQIDAGAGGQGGGAGRQFQAAGGLWRPGRPNWSYPH